MKEEIQNTTLKRFCLAILEKSSVSHEVLEILIQNEVLTWLLVSLNTVDSSEESSPFLANYATAFLLNCTTFLMSNARNLKDLIPGGSEFVRIFEFLKSRSFFNFR